MGAMLNYNIKGTGLEVTPELRAYVERGLGHAEKFVQGDSTAHVDIELEYQELRHGEHYRAEFTFSIGGEVYRAEKWAGSMHAAIDMGADDLARELRRTKRKRLHFVRRGAARIKDFVRGWRTKI